jgi:hypothetical protein
VKELVLIGTVHRDPDGVYKLRKILEDERPTAVAVELSPYGLSYRWKNGHRLHRLLRRRLTRLAKTHNIAWRVWGQIDAIEAQLRIPFEYRAALKYCRDSDAELRCIDSSFWSRRLIHDQWKQLLSSENLEALIKQPPSNHAQEVEEEYKLATLLLTQPVQRFVTAFTQTWSADPEWQQRERELAHALEEIYASLHQGRLTYVGGWQHLIGPESGGTVYERLFRLQPRRILLGDVYEEVNHKGHKEHQESGK